MLDWRSGTFRSQQMWLIWLTIFEIHWLPWQLMYFESNTMFLTYIFSRCPSLYFKDSNLYSVNVNSALALRVEGTRQLPGRLWWQLTYCRTTETNRHLQFLWNYLVDFCICFFNATFIAFKSLVKNICTKSPGHGWNFLVTAAVPL